MPNREELHAMAGPRRSGIGWRMLVLGAGGLVALGFLVPRGSSAWKPAGWAWGSGRGGASGVELVDTGPEWDIANLDHERVDYWVDRFVTVPEMRQKMEGFLHRLGWYEAMLEERLAARGMPHDLVYLAMIESGFQARAYSPARAAGLWQFVEETGRRYGLAVDRAVDERNDPVRSTEAALDYLSELHSRFGSWYLAAAAYNTGENRVGRIMRERFGRERAQGEGEYYVIWPDLPAETRDYVPLMIAAARIAKDPGRYGFDHIGRGTPRDYTEILVPPATPLEDIADAAGITTEELRLLNPHFRIDRTPNDRDYPVRLPPTAVLPFAVEWSLAREKP